MAGKDPDQDLVAKARNGDNAAFGKLVKQYYEMVHGLAYGVLRHHEKARDVAQDVFLKVFRDLENFEGKSKFKTWLYRVSINAALDEARKKRPVESLDSSQDAEDDDSRPLQIADQGSGPREQASRQELRILLDRAIEKLTPDHRAVLVLRQWQGYSYEEIAETLNLEIGTVMSRLHYAKRRLAEILGNYEDPVVPREADSANRRVET